jgi:lipopolysaccharide transport system permease protein
MSPASVPALVPAASASTEVVTLEPTRGWFDLGLSEVWRHRELSAFLVWRDIKVRYKQTVLGVFWAILQPLVTMVVFSLVFGRMGKIPSDGAAYPIFSFAGLVPWTLFARGFGIGSGSLLASQNMLKKAYFPRLALPVASVLGSVFDFLLALGMLLLLMPFFGVPLTARLLWLPALSLLAFLVTLGASIWTSALNVVFRDIRYAVPFLIQILLFATPIAYPSSQVPEPWRGLLALNPLAGVVEGFRWAILGVDTKPGGMILVSTVFTLILCVSGIVVFRRLERSFADVV